MGKKHEIGRFIVDTEDPIMHSHPEQCKRCGVLYYIGHVCPKKLQDRKPRPKPPWQK